MMDMVVFGGYLLSFLLVLSIVVIVHEWGHFLQHGGAVSKLWLFRSGSVKSYGAGRIRKEPNGGFVRFRSADTFKCWEMKMRPA